MRIQFNAEKHRTDIESGKLMEKVEIIKIVLWENDWDDEKNEWSGEEEFDG